MYVLSSVGRVVPTSSAAVAAVGILYQRMGDSLNRPALTLLIIDVCCSRLFPALKLRRLCAHLSCISAFHACAPYTHQLTNKCRMSPD